MFVMQIIDKMTAYGHVAGLPIECLSIAVELHKEQLVNENGQQVSHSYCSRLFAFSYAQNS